jgi:hypothetical protein
MRVIAILLFTVQMLSVHAQENISDVDTSRSVRTTPVYGGKVTRAAGLQYSASAWKKLWWGEHYRREWVTPVSFPVLNISNTYGGLVPLKMGGGHQTKTLRLMSPAGKEYVLRTIDKSLDVLVPDYLKGTFINDLVNDQISTAHPYGPVAISRLADAVSILHTNPAIYYIAPDSSLGEYNAVFANKLALIEERPSGKGWEHTALSGYADDVVNTEKMLEKVFANSKNAVDQQSFLKVRLFDMIVNDWDRHEDQWVWADNKTGDKSLFVPIGRDRDQAFSRTDGLGLFFLSKPWAFRPLKDLKPAIKDVRGLNFSARNLDQQFLNHLTRQQWQSVIDTIQSSLTDQAIQNAVKAMPEEANKHFGETLIKRLRQRRNDISASGMKYYSALSENVHINGSAKDESFIVDFINKNKAAVTGLHYNTTDTFFHRVFYRKETKEINIYGLDGNDRFVVKGNARNPFVVRLIGGEGQNEYRPDVKKIYGKRPKIYDSLPLPYDSRRALKTNNRWDSLYSYDRTSAANYDWYIPIVQPGYNSDDGFTMSLGLLYKRRQWGKSPFGWEQQLVATYASGTGAVGFDYAGLFRNTFGKWDFDLKAFYKGPRYTFFYYGMGNETKLKGDSRSFYRVKGNDFYVNPGISRTWRSNYLRLGLQYENVEILRNQNKFITTHSSDVDAGVFDAKDFAGINGRWEFFNAGRRRYPTNGFHLSTGFSFMNNLNNTDRRFLNITSSATFYHTFFKKLTLAHRTGAATNFGDFDFYHANALGLDNNLRGYWKSRFTGKTSFYQNTEVRLAAAQLKGYYVRGTLGVYGFFDDGRVWLKDEESSKMHVGYGGGAYFLPYNLTSFSLFYSRSKEASMVTLRAGFFF